MQKSTVAACCLFECFIGWIDDPPRLERFYSTNQNQDEILKFSLGSNPMDGTVHIVALDQKPCVVHYLDQYNKFIVGTYELFPSIEDARLKLNSHLDDNQLKKTLEEINYRAGRLILLRGNDVSVPSIEYEFDCYAGGVFDAKVRYNKQDSSYNIYVAHSNGTIGIYKLSLHCGNKICLKEQINVTGSKMLTSIDIFPEFGCVTDTIDRGAGNSFLYSSSSSISQSPLSGVNSSKQLDSSNINRLTVGDADGFVTVISQSGEPIRENVAQGDSIWQVKTLRLASGRDVVIVGAENSSWYIYGVNGSDRRLVLLYKNAYKDFSAGVTCISILDIFHSIEHDLVEIWLGSYDETLQTYHVKINHDGVSKPDVCHKNTISVDNGGIWRVKAFKNNNKRQLCIAAMYGGSYILPLGGSDRQQSDQQQQKQLRVEGTLIRLIDTESMELNHKPLHYDIDVSSCNTTYCIVDFNNSLCLFKTID